MKKTLILALFLAFSGYAKSDVTSTACNCLSTTVTFASNYIFRAMSYNSQGTAYQSQGSPVVQTSLDYTKNGVVASFFTGNADAFNTKTFLMEKDVEADSFVSYTYPFTDSFGLGVGYNYYSFQKNVDNDMGEWAVLANYKNLSLISSYIDRFSGVDTNYWHSNLLLTQPVLERLNVILSVGRTYFGNPYVVATSSYYDYHVGLQTVLDGFKAEVFYTNTWNRTNPYDDTYTKSDGTFTVTFSKTLNIL